MLPKTITPETSIFGRAWLAMLLCVGAAGISYAQTERVGPFIERYEPREWRLTTHVTLGHQIDSPVEAKHTPHKAWGTNRLLLSVPGAVIGTMPVEQGTVFWPVAGRAASYEVDRESVSARLLAGGNELPAKMGLIDSNSSNEPLHSGAAYGQWEFGPYASINLAMLLEFTFEAKTWNTRFNESAAREVAWPTGDWPAEAASTFGPMLFIDGGFEGEYQHSRAADLVKRYTQGKAKSQPPVVVAKWIAGELAKSFQPTGQFAVPDSIAASSTQTGRSLGTVQAISVTGAEHASNELAGTPVDLPLLLTALYREAGLPARLVVGYVAGEKGGADDPDRRADKPELGLYAWVEFALYDESRPAIEDALTWVPVDILYMRANNVGRRGFDQTWEGFGTSELLSEVIPISYHLHPHELAAASYGRASLRHLRLRSCEPCNNAIMPLPSLWGWNVVPSTPCYLHQAMAFSATTPSQTIEDQRARNRGR